MTADQIIILAIPTIIALIGFLSNANSLRLQAKTGKERYDDMEKRLDECREDKAEFETQIRALKDRIETLERENRELMLRIIKEEKRT